jgi:hypothetical protein
MVINVAQARSLSRQDAWATVSLLLLLTTKLEEPPTIKFVLLLFSKGYLNSEFIFWND